MCTTKIKELWRDGGQKSSEFVELFHIHSRESFVAQLVCQFGFPYFLNPIPHLLHRYLHWCHASVIYRCQSWFDHPRHSVCQRCSRHQGSPVIIRSRIFSTNPNIKACTELPQQDTQQRSQLHQSRIISYVVPSNAFYYRRSMYS